MSNTRGPESIYPWPRAKVKIRPIRYQKLVKRKNRPGRVCGKAANDQFVVTRGSKGWHRREGLAKVAEWPWPYSRAGRHVAGRAASYSGHSPWDATRGRRDDFQLFPIICTEWLGLRVVFICVRVVDILNIVIRTTISMRYYRKHVMKNINDVRPAVSRKNVKTYLTCAVKEEYEHMLCRRKLGVK